MHGRRAHLRTSVPTRIACRGLSERNGQRQSLYGIVQGGMYKDLRAESAARLVDMDFDGYAIGGLAVGEPREVTREIIEHTLALLPKDKPRYVMGVGYPEEIVEYAQLGVDQMDCVLPTRAARHGLMFTSEGRLNIGGKRFAEDSGPPDPACTCCTCRTLHSRVPASPLPHRRTAGGNSGQRPQSVVLPGHRCGRLRADNAAPGRVTLRVCRTLRRVCPSVRALQFLFPHRSTRL